MVCGEKEMKLTWKIWLLIIVLVFSLLSIFGFPPKFFQEGVLITSVGANSTSFDAGLRQNQIISEVDGFKITNLEDYIKIIQNKFPSDESIKTIMNVGGSEIILFSKVAPEITVSEIRKTNIQTGLDLAGGSRGLVQAKDAKLSLEEINDLIDVIGNRLNVYGIADMNIRPVSDLDGNNFMLIEIAGATPNDLEELISKQGKFEAKIGNETAFIGGEKDIASVCRNDATCAAVEQCSKSSEGYVCKFGFVIYLSEAAAEKHAKITETLGVNSTPQGNYLSSKLDLYLDGNLVDSLLISEGLRGRVTTQIKISGSGEGKTQSEAYEAAEDAMHKLQTILITGSLPYKLEIVKLDTISPLLGKEFIRSIFLAGFVALFAVSLIIFFRYKRFKSSMALILTSISEVIIILGIASFIDWNLDLPSIAGILATIGTGIDQQIIILDEAKQKTILSLKQKLKRAFAIILGTYFTALVSLLPLMSAGAGLLKGFAITTIIGITTGVLITRPAFTDMIKRIEE
ncbi:MAG: preprotein translocase subunit SecD [archaeon]